MNNGNHFGEPEISKKDVLLYIFYSFIVDAALAVFLFFRIARIILDESSPLSIDLPPVTFLFALGLVLLFSMKTLTFWRKSANHPNRAKLRIFSVALLGNIWIMLLITLYIDKFLKG